MALRVQRLDLVMLRRLMELRPLLQRKRPKMEVVTVMVVMVMVIEMWVSC